MDPFEKRALEEDAAAEAATHGTAANDYLVVEPSFTYNFHHQLVSRTPSAHARIHDVMGFDPGAVVYTDARGSVSLVRIFWYALVAALVLVA